MPQVNINDSQYYYEIQGAGSPIVLVAGYSCDQSFWQNVVKSLSKKFQVLTFDNLAAGQTQDNQQLLTLERMADESTKLLKALKIEKPTVVGHSMGGIIAQLIAEKNPQSVKQVIVLNAARKINTRSLMALKNFLKLVKEGAPIETVIEASMSWFFSSRFLENPHNIISFKQMILSNPHPQTLEDLSRQLQALTMFAVEESNINVPTLVVAAKDDILCLPAESEKLAKAIPGAQFMTMNGGHSTPIECPEEVAQLIAEFHLKN